MRRPILGKSAVVALLLSTCAFAANAQKIDEQELKTNVSKIANPTAQLRNLEPVTFKYDTVKFKHLGLPSGEQYGFMSGNVKAEFPALVKVNSKVYGAGKNNSKVASYDAVQSQDLIPVLVAAVKAQQEEIELLKKELSLLKKTSK